MKQVKSKITGDIGELDFDSKEGIFIVIYYDLHTKATIKNYYKSLEDLCEGWEDYEEPKGSEYYWYIGYKNDIRRTKYHHISGFADNQVTETRKEIGNCFESLEEAEKAVEKLKAWKRLKDKGFRFVEWTENSKDEITSQVIRCDFGNAGFDDLDLLFGGEK